MDVILFALPAIVAAAITLVLTPFIRRLAATLGAIDPPGPRKVHSTPIARMGGIGVVVSVGAVLAAGTIELTGTRGWAVRHQATAMAAGLLPILAISLVDDIRRVAPLPKLLFHAAGATLAIAGGVVLPQEVHLLGLTIPLGPLAAPLTLLWIVGVTNAFNIIDGLDGLAAGLGVISAATLGAILLIFGETGMAWAALVLAGAIAGFLPYNFYPARIFLGDSGATAIGFLLACFSTTVTSKLSAGFAVLLPLFVLAVPVADTALAIARRSLARMQHPATAPGVMQADRNHIHHRLLALGVRHRNAVLILYAVAIGAAGLALTSIFMRDQWAGLLLLALLVAGCVGVSRLGYEEFATARRRLALGWNRAPAMSVAPHRPEALTQEARAGAELAIN